MEDDNIAIRLKGFIDSCGLSHSQFADKCGIPRPSLSQILSGRNKKISDVIIGQIHRAFPDLSVMWLLFGEGSMLSVSNQGDEGAGSEAGADNGRALGAESQSAGVTGFGFGVGAQFGPGTGASMSGDGDEAQFSGVNDSKFPSNRTGAEEFSNLRALNTPSEAMQLAEKQIVEAEKRIAELQTQIEKMRKNPRKVTHITVYYDDSTFETFTPQS